MSLSCGTVFQTALLFMVIVPRLRPGLLSLCSVLASSQHSMFVVGKKICLEDNTERNESNPGRSLGITNNKGRAVWKTVPH